MENKRINERHQIKVNRLSSENEKFNPYSTNLKSGNLHLKTSPTKNPILYKVRLKPENIINKNNQTSNNIKTNINKGSNKSGNSNINNINFNNQSNNLSFNKPYGQYLNSKNGFNDNNSLDMNKSYNNKRNIRNIGYNNNSENYLDLIENKNKKAIFSPLSVENKEIKKDNEYKKREINNAKNIKLNLHHKKISDCIFQSLIDNTKHNINNSIVEKYNFLNKDNPNSKYDSNNIRTHKNNSQESINSSNIKNRKRNNSTLSSINYAFQTSTVPSQINVNSLRDQKMKEMNHIIFSSASTLSDIFRKELKSNKNLITNDNNPNPLNIKLEYYRIKLFKEFLKHFQLFYKSYIKNELKHFFEFLKKNSNNKNVSLNNNSFIYNRKNNIRNYNTIENTNRSNQSNNIIINNKFNLINAYKTTSTINDNYNLYNQLKKNKSINNKIKNILNNYSYKEFNTSDSNININNSISVNSINNYNYNLNSAPRKHRNISTITRKRNREYQNLFTSNSKSPSFRIGNKTIINNDINFGDEKENKLYRDSKQLNKKYEQIQRRRQRKNVDTILNQSKEVNTNRSMDNKNIKNSEEYNEFVELRKFVQKMRSKRKLNQSALNINQKVKDEPNYNNVYNVYAKRIGNYNKNDNNSIYKNNDSEKKNEIIKSCSHINNAFSKINIKENNNNTFNNNNNIYNNNNFKTINEDKSYKRVRVNINKRFLVNRKVNNDNNKMNNNYNYRIIQSNFKLENSPNFKNNIYLKTNNNNDNSNGNSQFIPILIKNISTKDKRINITIYYYHISTYYKSMRKEYNHLIRAYNCSISVFGNANIRTNNFPKLKFKLSSIKEEDISNQNSKFYDESGTLDKNNTYESKTNNNNQ